MRADSLTPTSVPRLQFEFSTQPKQVKKTDKNLLIEQQGYHPPGFFKEKEEPHKLVGSNSSFNNKVIKNPQNNLNMNMNNKIPIINIANQNNLHINMNMNMNNHEQLVNKILTNSTKATNSPQSLKNEFNFKTHHKHAKIRRMSSHSKHSSL